MHPPSLPHAARRTPAGRLSVAVSRLARAWIRNGRESARALELSLPQLVLVRSLREMGEIPIRRWADEVGASPSAMTGLLDGLEAAGYVRRSPGQRDRRNVLISLTPSGRRTADRLVREYASRWQRLCVGIAPERLRDAAATIEEIVAHIEEASAA